MNPTSEDQFQLLNKKYAIVFKYEYIRLSESVVYAEAVCFATIDRYILPKKYNFTRPKASAAAVRNTKILDELHVMIPTYNFAEW